MTTFLDLQNRVLALIIDTPTTVTSAVPRLVNNAIRTMQRRYNFKAMEGSTTFITTVDSLALGTIARFKEYRDRGPYLTKQYNRARKFLTAPDTAAPLASLVNSEYPEEPEFVIHSLDVNTEVHTFTVSPYPDNHSDWDDGLYRIVVPYYAYTATLTSDAETNWFTNNADEYIEYLAAAEGFGLDHDYDSMAIWLQRAEEKYKQVVLADKRLRISGVDTFVPHWEGANSPQVRR